MRMLLHETLPTSGTVIINGYNITKMKRQDIPYLRRSLGIVFQDYRLLPDKTVYEKCCLCYASYRSTSPSNTTQRK